MASDKPDWIKLDTEMFSNPKIKYIRTLPDGNNLILIWVMLITMAGRCNAGGMIMLTENIPYTPKMLADELKFEESTIRLALEVFERLGMISVNMEVLSIPGWYEHQSEQGLEKIRKQNAIRQQNYRDKNKKLKIEDKSNVTHNVTHNVTVTDSSYSISYSYSNSISNIVNYLNNKLDSNYKPNSKNTIKHIKARLDEGFTEEDFYSVIDYKVSQWGNDNKMRDYLRPDTLFGTKFESYLQNAPKKKSEPVKPEPIEEESVDYGWEDDDEI